MISINKVYTGYDSDHINMRWDWNSLLTEDYSHLFKNYSRDYFPNAKYMVQYLQDFANKFQLHVKCNTAATCVSRQDGLFSVEDNRGCTYKSRCLIIASGLLVPFVPDIEGMDLTEQYSDVSVDANDFINQRVLVIGKSNAGFEIANNLTSTASMIHIASRNPLKFAWRTHHAGHLRALNTSLLDTYQLKSQNGVIDATINAIQKRGEHYEVEFAYTHAHGEVERIVYDRVIRCTGWQFDNSIFSDDCQPERVIDNRFPSMTSSWESTNVPDLFFAGTLTQALDFKKKQSSFIHGFRYNIDFMSKILEQKYHNQAIPYSVLSRDSAQLTEAIVKSINETSSLWQQTGFLADIVAIYDDRDTVAYYTGVPVNYVHDGSLGSIDHYLVITLEFNQPFFDRNPDIFNINRVHKKDISHAQDSNFLHPVVRLYAKGGSLLTEHHMIEDFASVWDDEVRHISTATSLSVESCR